MNKVNLGFIVYYLLAFSLYPVDKVPLIAAMLHVHLLLCDQFYLKQFVISVSRNSSIPGNLSLSTSFTRTCVTYVNLLLSWLKILIVYFNITVSANSFYTFT